MKLQTHNIHFKYTSLLKINQINFCVIKFNYFFLFLFCFIYIKKKPPEIKPFTIVHDLILLDMRLYKKPSSIQWNQINLKWKQLQTSNKSSSILTLCIIFVLINNLFENIPNQKTTIFFFCWNIKKKNKRQIEIMLQ